MPQPLANEHYTYADYLEWDNDERYELINGEAVMMASPTFAHQLVSAELVRQFGNFLSDKPCQVLHAPLDVRLFEKDEDSADYVDTVVQPDLLVLCDKRKRDNHGIKGAPDLIIEILSPSNFRNDCLVKLNLYQQAGVREYWIVDPEEKTVHVFLLSEDTTYRHLKPYGQNDTVKVNVLEGCVIELDKVFSEI